MEGMFGLVSKIQSVKCVFASCGSSFTKKKKTVQNINKYYDILSI